MAQMNADDAMGNCIKPVLGVFVSVFLSAAIGVICGNSLLYSIRGANSRSGVELRRDYTCKPLLSAPPPAPQLVENN
jgi:hypothetical protein